jgi:formyl-CoA transferase
MNPPQPANGPLAGVKVLDLSAYIAGPYAASLLADLGAEVIKIEPPEGDALRHYPSTLEAESRAFLGVNRSKRGMVIDLKEPEGLELFRRLAAASDVVIHNFRPNVPERLGIDYASLRNIRADIVYCALTGYGQKGPLAGKAGYDQVLQSLTGICAFQGEDKGHPEIVYGSVVDFYAASLAANAITAALFRRERTGQGCEIDMSLLAAALAMQATRFIRAEGEPDGISRDMRSGGVTGLHPCAGGTWLYLSANTPHFWRALCAKAGLGDLARDARYDSVRKRAERASELVPRLRAVLAARPALEWEAYFGEEVPCCAVRQMNEMFDHPQVAAQKLAADLVHPGLTYRGLASVFAFDGEKAEAFAAPARGQHSDIILGELGLSGAEIAALRAKGVVG